MCRKSGGSCISISCLALLAFPFASGRFFSGDVFGFEEKGVTFGLSAEKGKSRLFSDDFGFWGEKKVKTFF